MIFEKKMEIVSLKVCLGVRSTSIEALSNVGKCLMLRDLKTLSVIEMLEFMCGN